jgi:hypothetical protein
LEGEEEEGGRREKSEKRTEGGKEKPVTDPTESAESETPVVDLRGELEGASCVKGSGPCSFGSGNRKSFLACPDFLTGDWKKEMEGEVEVEEVSSPKDRYQDTSKSH